ncbi:hypothetical protein O181_062623 [Austropuccinia psidii MF-1]|uniref:Uncharacterized protein n=1 Tax=Austropuccinia psidii MF-1 TaxID=1389203 RepID=A0A9Q3HZQ5_9BASI|nr:hypothetical protein [Austropuccinia psidii MF-1]
MEGNVSAKDIVRDLEKEQEELNKKFMEKKTVQSKPEEEMQDIPKKPKEKLTSIAHVEKWSYWKPHTISSENDPYESNIGLRKTKRLLERQNQSQSEEVKKKFPMPGTYIEEKKEREKIMIQNKFKNSNTPKNVQHKEGI